MDRPLRQRFEITEDTLTALSDAGPVTKYADSDRLIDTLKPMLGTVWATLNAASNGLHSALAEAGVSWPPTAVSKALWAAVAVSDPAGELQTKQGNRCRIQACAVMTTYSWQRTSTNT